MLDIKINIQKLVQLAASIHAQQQYSRTFSSARYSESD